MRFARCLLLSTGALLVILATALSGCDNSLPEPRKKEDLEAGDFTLVAPVVKDTMGTAEAMHSGVPVTVDDLLSDYTSTHEVPPLARTISSGQKLDLAKGAEALALVDSMLNARDAYSRLFYFVIVSRTLKWSDGFYSEGVGNKGTGYLFRYPSEFLSQWWDLLSADERLQWADLLASEQAIITEGYPCDTVMLVFRSRLEAALGGHKEQDPVADRLTHQIDSLLCAMKEIDR